MTVNCAQCDNVTGDAVRVQDYGLLCPDCFNALQVDERTSTRLCGATVSIGDHVKVRYTTGREMKDGILTGIVTKVWPHQAQVNGMWCFHDHDELLEHKVRIQELLEDPNGNDEPDRLLSEYAVLAVLRARLEAGGGGKADYEFAVVRELLAELPPREACPRCKHVYPAPTTLAASVTCGACGFVNVLDFM